MERGSASLISVVVVVVVVVPRRLDATRSCKAPLRVDADTWGVLAVLALTYQLGLLRKRAELSRNAMFERWLQLYPRTE